MKYILTEEEYQTLQDLVRDVAVHKPVKVHYDLWNTDKFEIKPHGCIHDIETNPMYCSHDCPVVKQCTQPKRWSK